jgi:hypothetical protein
MPPGRSQKPKRASDRASISTTVGDMPRTPELRLRLFDRHVNELINESGSRATWTISWDRDRGTSSQPPDRESLRSWLLAVRGLDAPRDDTYLPTVMDDLDALASDDLTRQRVGEQRAQRDRVQAISPLGTITGPLAAMTPSECFKMLAYTDHLHHEADREAKRAEMPPHIWDMVQVVGWAYASDLADIATWLQAAGRQDPATAHLFEQTPPDDQAPD